ncbi:MAG: dienelactone hydrolase [Pseudomonas sp. PGPPP4]|uniref:dienelactone hydrolase family protein n=1 Tax=Pseudomonas sp. PGPPP4 TaxID=2015556 RepID=UPI000BD9C9DF|nr:dienelactone hydrolase family protein [Pseudomonas sp. PGPPP4]OYT83453.1 MAG: dienelactone hydrolase [Pseudomonas sp. PGPPP4]
MVEVTVKPVAYEIDGQPFESQLVYATSGNPTRPGVLLAPNWMGVSHGAVEQAKGLAEADGLAYLVVDFYGRNVRPQNADEALAAMTPIRGDRALLRQRMQAAYAALIAQAETAAVDVHQIAAIGFCFGGCAALELARDGAALSAVVTFHANLDTPNPADAARITGPVLVLHGASDPLVPDEQLTGFRQEMDAAQVDWQLLSYGGAVHSFTDPEANNPGKQQYHPVVAKRAFLAMHNLFDEVFAQG